MTTVRNDQRSGFLTTDRAAAPGPHSSDGNLLAWRQAATNGGLPVPARKRWQQLRGGVVNMWEFDVEEYWCADGRAQFVGGNETGKSTLMALTTLIMLDGSLDRSNIDTFGQQHKAFRYYLEPTDSPKDRRDTSAQTNRGWTWVEYGRLVDDVPEYFTTLLYGQTKRGVSDVSRTWITCTGEARVRAGITLVRSQSVLTPADISNIPGLERHPNGTAYKKAVSAKLFEFAEADRMESIIGMLKVLRTPQLGQRLDPTWFTDQMRRALPSMESSEIDELAEGWDQLDRLARDRDSATEARNAVKVYLRRAWNPWADALLRRAADDLAAANTEFDNVTRRYREAATKLSQAEKHLLRCREEHATANQWWEDLSGEYDTLIKSRAYADAQAATDRVQRLGHDAEASQRRAADLHSELEEAEATAQGSTHLMAVAEAEAEVSRAERDAAAQRCIEAFKDAGIPAMEEWAKAGDIDRLTTAATQRRTRVTQLRQLIRATEIAENEHRNAESRHQESTGRQRERQNAAAQADTAAEVAVQDLSDAIETWATSLPQFAPDPLLREHWVNAVAAQAASPNPRTVLRNRIGTDWLTHVIEPLTTDAGAAIAKATAASGQARDLGRQAEAKESEKDPTPAAPAGWLRRDRPVPGVSGTGAPLWRLLDPAGDVDETTLAMIEAALSGAGLLDAWVTPDRVWAADREGDDAVVTLTTEPGPAVRAATLASVLAPATDAGPMTRQIVDLLDRVAYVGAGAELPDVYAVSGDGRWCTPVTSGRAAPEHKGPSLLGAAARAAARARQVASLREQAAQLHADATELTDQADVLKGHVAALRRAGQDAPTDDDAVATARAAVTAATELEKATAEAERAERQAREAETRANDARATQLTYAGDHHLPTDGAELEGVGSAVDSASSRAQDLRTELNTVRIAERRQAELTDRAGIDAEVAARRQAASNDAEKAARRAKVQYESAKSTLGSTEQELLGKATRLQEARDIAHNNAETLQESVAEQVGVVATAKEALKRHDADRGRAEATRAEALQVWWTPVDAGLAAARGLDPATGRSVFPALTQARQARDKLQPRNWPEGKDRRADRDAIVNGLLSKMVGERLVELNLILEATGGRTATALTSEDSHVLTQISVLVDAAGAAVDPVTAVAVLDEKAADLARLHDEKLHGVLEELLSSTFVEHLRDRMKSTLKLLEGVNEVLAAHPTGARQTVLRLTKVPATGQAAGYRVLDTLVDGFVDSPTVQEEVRRFLERQIRDAQELGAETGQRWQEHLATLLDYRRWFDVVTEFKVFSDERKRSWKALTKEVHGQDSGGAKVVTLLQPLLATLVAMYDDCHSAPRPLWLDEAFEGVDADNRSTMLDLFIDFDLDFLLAGPSTLVASSNVPVAAVWYVHKAPGSAPGVSLSLMLWAGNELVQVNIPPLSWRATPTVAEIDGEP